MKLADLRGRLTLVLTPELRQFALDQVRQTLPEGNDQRDDLIAWFQVQETPDGSVLDAAYSEAEATMIDVILQAILDAYNAPVAEPDLDEEIRVITRY